MKKNKRIIFRISDELNEHLQILCSVEKKTVSSYLRSLIENESTVESLEKAIKERKKELKELQKLTN